MPYESNASAPKSWIVERKRIVGRAELFLKQHGCLAEFKDRFSYLKKEFRRRTGLDPDKEERVKIYWETAWVYVDACVDSTPVEHEPEPEPEPEPEEKLKIFEGATDKDGNLIPPGPREPEEILVDMSLFDGKDAPPLVAIQWAVEHVHIIVGPEDAPSKLAYSILIWAQKNPAQMNTLFSTLLPKIVPKTKDEGGDSLTDDGGVISLLDNIERMSKEMNDD